ncbi:hypothetical protein Hanom_Chr06g00543451 [Helianthus anomalus]
MVKNKIRLIVLSFYHCNYRLGSSKTNLALPTTKGVFGLAFIFLAYAYILK